MHLFCRKKRTFIIAQIVVGVVFLFACLCFLICICLFLRRKRFVHHVYENRSRNEVDLRETEEGVSLQEFRGLDLELPVHVVERMREARVVAEQTGVKERFAISDLDSSSGPPFYDFNGREITPGSPAILPF